MMTLTPHYAQAAKDTVNMINGTTIKGRIIRVTSGLVNMKTKEGFRKFSRIQILNNRDFVEIGFTNRKIIAGKVFCATKYSVELYTPEGIIQIPRYRVRKIVLGHVHIPEEQLQIQLPEQVEKEAKNIP